jgi:plasmid maintenance system antidote protein VapI
MRIDKKYKYNPDYVVAPGKLIQEYMDYYSLIKEEFAERLGIGIEVFNEILKGTRPISCEIAEKLEAINGINSDTWLAMDKSYWAPKK